MWLVNFIRKIVFPLFLILLFSWLCLLFLWNNCTGNEIGFDNLNKTWFNVTTTGVFAAPKGVLGSAVASHISGVYNNHQITSALKITDFFRVATIRGLSVVYVMPIGVSLLFGIAVFTVLSILWSIIHTIVKKRLKKGKEKTVRRVYYEE